MNLLKSTIGTLLTKDKEVQAFVTGYDYETGNMIAQVKQKRAIISQDDITVYQKDDEIHQLLGTTVTCTVLGKNEDDELLLSRKIQMQKRIRSHKKGDVVIGTVYSASDKALFLHFDDGLSGRLYTNKLTSAQVKRPLDIYNVGDQIKCVITNVHEDEGYFDLSRLDLYKQVNLNLQIGNIIKCRVTKKEEQNTGWYVEVLANPTYSGIFDLNRYNQNINFRPGQIVDLRVIKFKNKNQLKLRTISKNEA